MAADPQPWHADARARGGTLATLDEMATEEKGELVPGDINLDY